MILPEDCFMEDCVYPVEDIEAVRQSLVTQWMLKPSRSEFHMQLKRKCGVFTPEVVAYFESGRRVRPDKFNADYVYKSELVNENDEIILDLNDDDDDVDDDNDDNNQDEVNTVAAEIDMQRELDLLEDQFEKIGRTVEKKSHACFLDRYCKMCPYTMTTPASTSSTSTVVYVCNFCRQCYSSASRMKQHMEDRCHFSAGEYESATNTINSSVVMNYAKCEISGTARRELIATRKRVGIQLTDKPEEKSSKGVFCPKCDAFYSVDVLACAVHYRFLHGTPLHGYMYSVSELQDVRDIALTARHTCLTCNLKFKRLKDLMSHLEVTRHAPMAPLDQIYVYRCSRCHFRTTYFMEFKLHVMGEHRQVAPLTDDDPSTTTDGDQMYGEVFAYAKPTEFYHLSAPNTQAEYKEEMEIIDKLLRTNNNKLTMGVTDLLVKPLLDRKSELSSLIIIK